MSNFFDRLMQFAESQGIKNPQKLSEKLKYKSAEKIYRLERDKTANPSYNMVREISNAFENLNVHWLITGTGHMTFGKVYDLTDIVPTSQLREEKQNYKEKFSIEDIIADKVIEKAGPLLEELQNQINVNNDIIQRMFRRTLDEQQEKLNRGNIKEEGKTAG